MPTRLPGGGDGGAKHKTLKEHSERVFYGSTPTLPLFPHFVHATPSCSLFSSQEGGRFVYTTAYVVAKTSCLNHPGAGPG